LLSDLQASLGTLDDDAREDATASIAAISRRLREGDVWPGDIVDLRVLGEDRWTMNYTVTPMRTISLEAIDPIDVSGVLHSELEERIATSLGRYLREPRIEVDVLKRVGVLGNVGNPGFYTTQGNALVSDVIMLAGGPGANANVDKIEFRRLGEPLDIGPQVVWQSMSLDELGIQSGDEVYVPQRGSSSAVSCSGRSE
jgi:protein involved in polysaccharide export with SLBB domain